MRASSRFPCTRGTGCGRPRNGPPRRSVPRVVQNRAGGSNAERLNASLANRRGRQRFPRPHDRIKLTRGTAAGRRRLCAAPAGVGSLSHSSGFGGHHGAVRARLHRLFVGGSDGNERLTAATAVVLIVLLAAEGLTLLGGVGRYLTPHIFIGLLVIP